MSLQDNATRSSSQASTDGTDIPGWCETTDLWAEILNIHPPGSLRDFLTAHNNLIRYVDVNTDTVAAGPGYPGGLCPVCPIVLITRRS